MLSTSAIALFSSITFDLYNPAVLGSGFKNAKVMGILTAQDALHYSPVQVQHADMYPMLPAGTPDDFTAYPYLKLVLDDGNTIAIGLPWIVDASYVVNNTQKMTIVLPSVSPDDQTRVKAALSAIGMKNFVVTLS